MEYQPELLKSGGYNAKPQMNLNAKAKRRRAALTVEFAMTAPIFFLFVFGCVEFARVHMIQAAMENAAFEGARRGIIPGATASNCESSASILLNYAGLKEATISVDPQIIDANADSVSVTVNVPMTVENGIGLTGYLTGKTLSRTITLPRENQ